ncbi:hypothetical protein [Candidatus Nitrospira nitrificans]|uniref:Restriction endonuclease n=1 Tax=Candidatus Nitrospira nitrificans TaxID=1742973 RepID=A0A0S4LTU6_9BACT|nr:hypothetical protein [Candidatus Nitrospira nitrificans]CUS39302.1 hypothetical protein COMA2_70070 [Candidatus Nitrospira nitrificans]
MQFEWAYRLQAILRHDLSTEVYIGCEKQFIDIVIYNGPPFGSSKDNPSTNEWQKFPDIRAGIELKWLGSWSFDMRFSINPLMDDLRKINDENKYPFPVLSLALILIAQPRADPGSSTQYAWITAQVNQKKGKGSSERKGFYDYSEMREKLFRAMPDQKLVHGRDYIEMGPYPIKAKEFEKLELRSLGFYNNRAKAINSTTR